LEGIGGNWREGKRKEGGEGEIDIEERVRKEKE